MNYKRCLFVASLGALGGCAPMVSSTFNYTPPSSQSAPANSRIETRPFEEVWDALVRELSSDFFAINNIEKSSRIINLSFTAQGDEMARFVDCGKSRRTYQQGKSVTNYDYSVAAPATYKMAATRGPQIAQYYLVARRPSLDGRINIYVAPLANGTEIKVNTRYIVKLMSSVQTCTLNIYQQELGCSQAQTNETTSISFNTTSEGQHTDQSGTMTCRATGALETHILDLVGS